MVSKTPSQASTILKLQRARCFLVSSKLHPCRTSQGPRIPASASPAPPFRDISLCRPQGRRSWISHELDTLDKWRVGKFSCSPKTPSDHLRHTEHERLRNERFRRDPISSFVQVLGTMASVPYNLNSRPVLSR